jgi:hypothetical protein
MLTRKAFVAVAVLGFGTTAYAQDFFDFDQIAGPPDNPSVQMDLNPALIGIASATTRSTDPVIADLLDGIRGVRVRIYNSLRDSDDVAGYIERVSERLEMSDWQQVVRVREDHDVRLYMRGTDDVITGLTAMVFSDAEAIFVSIAGTITGQQLGALTSAIGAGEVFASLGQLDILPQAPQQ